ncbi:MAG TPA: DUF2249 domain-containing protein [Rhodanobacteraceae bacterium]|jgi:uncharacterized protein (DUF2249 family)|nr:DUF2249 domain-containing protein [Rhodanobacteraceae bacterium]
MNATADTPTYQAYPFDARAIAHRFRHSAIFGALDALEPGEAMRFVNDHDPIPLLRQMQQRYGDHIAVIYRQRGGEGPVVIDFVVAQ